MISVESTDMKTRLIPSVFRRDHMTLLSHGSTRLKIRRGRGAYFNFWPKEGRFFEVGAYSRGGGEGVTEKLPLSHFSVGVFG